MNALIKTLLVLAVIGAINWGLIGFFQWNLIDAIFTGSGVTDATIGERVIYAIVGLAGLVALFTLPRLRPVEHGTTRTVHGRATA